MSGVLGASSALSSLGGSFVYGLSTFEQLLATAITVCLIAVLINLNRKPKFDLDKLPGPWKKAFPVVGNMLECLRPDFHRVLLQWADTYGGILRFKFLWRDALIVTEPTAVAVILGRGEGAMDKASSYYTPIDEMCNAHGNPNLLTSPSDDTWKVIRKAVALSFSSQTIKKKYPLVLSRINQLTERVKALGPQASIDVDQAALRVTLDVIGMSGFGHDFDCVSQDRPAYDHLIRVLPRCFTEVMLRMANPVRSLCPTLFHYGKKGSAAFAAFHQEMNKLLKALEARGMPSEDDTDIGSQLVRIMHNHPEISRDRILSELGILFVAGFETTGHTTSWTLFNIATVPGIQEKIAAELDGLGLLVKPGCPPPREVEWEDLKKIPYLTACVKEAMRMLPVVSFMGRIAGSDMNVGPYKIPKGTLVATPLFAVQNTIHNWEEPDKYIPERWLDVPVETYVYSKDKNADSGAAGNKRGITFMPFSEGPRNCVGQSLAKMEVLTLLTKLCGQFTIELTAEMGGREGVRARESTHLTLQTAGTQGIRCHLTPRA